MRIDDIDTSLLFLRWIFWFLAIFGTALFVLMWFSPETYRDTCKLEKLNKQRECKKNSNSKAEDNNRKQPVACTTEPINEIEKLNDCNKKTKSQISVDVSLVISTVSTDSMISLSPISPTTTITSSPPTSPTTLVSSNPTSPATAFSPSNSMLPIDASPSSTPSSQPQTKN